MKGTNILTLCQVEMKAAIQHYLETVLMKPDVAAGVEVVKVQQMAKGNEVGIYFEIEVQEKKVKP